MPKRILVTGAGGFVGTVLTAKLRGLEHAVVPFSADLRDEAAIHKAVEAATPDAVIHLAAIAAPREASKAPEQAWRINLMGTFHLARAVLRHAPAARFVWAGSSEAYGATFNHTRGLVQETSALQPLSAYGATKAAADLMLGQLAREGLDLVRFRPFNHTGAGQSPLYVVPAFAQQIAAIEAGRQDPVVRVGNLEAKRDFLDVRDIADAYAEAATRDEVQAGEAYNLARGNPVQIRDLLDLLTGLSAVPIRVEIDRDRYVANDVAIASGDPEKARRAFGWQARIPIEETVKEVLEYWRRQGKETA